MMKLHVLSLFPEFFQSFEHFGIVQRAVEDGRIQILTEDIRGYSLDKHHRVDDYPYAGGTGMVMTPQPLFDALKTKKHVIYMSPRGEKLTQKLARELAQYDELTILCGHYEGIDQRVIDTFVEREISIGDYILSGGEIAGMVLMDVLIRLVPGVIKEGAHSEESFENYLLEYDQYTRPEIFADQRVPAVLLSGNHKEIQNYRLEEAIRLTLHRRPDLLEEGIRQQAFDRQTLYRIQKIREEESHEF